MHKGHGVRATRWMVWVSAVALLAAGCTGSDEPDDPAGPTAGAQSIGSAGGQVSVSDQVQLDVPRGAVRGTITVQTTTSAPQAPLEEQWFTSTDGPVDIHVGGDRLRRPVAVRFTPDTAAPTPESVPVILHHDGQRWEMLALGRDQSSVTARTRDFSWYDFGWFDPSSWLNTTANGILWMFGKRHGTPTCRGTAPAWAAFQPAGIDAITSCATTNTAGTTPRVEVRLKNNRGYLQQVTIPPGVSFADAQGQPEFLRGLVREVTGADVVWLEPGAEMTVGFTQPGPGQGRLATIGAGVTPATLMVSSLLKAIAGELGSGESDAVLTVVYVLKQCVAGDPNSLYDLNRFYNGETTWRQGLEDAVKGTIGCFSALAGDPVRATVVADYLQGRVATKDAAQKMANLAEILKRAAWALGVIDVGADIIDLLADDYYNTDSGSIDSLATTIGLTASRPVAAACTPGLGQALAAGGYGGAEVVRCEGGWARVNDAGYEMIWKVSDEIGWYFRTEWGFECKARMRAEGAPAWIVDELIDVCGE